MTAIERTAYPRFKRTFTAKDLEEVYTPTSPERFLALRSTKGTVAEAGFLVLLKTHQRLGRFIPLHEVPVAILNHILKIVDPTLRASDLETYDTSGTRQRHIPLIRAARQLKPYDPTARTCVLKAMIDVARTKEDVADLINVALESLAKECFELPPFATLDKVLSELRTQKLTKVILKVHLPTRLFMRLPEEILARLPAVDEKLVVAPAVGQILPSYGGDGNSCAIRQRRNRSVLLLQMSQIRASDSSDV